MYSPEIGNCDQMAVTYGVPNRLQYIVKVLQSRRLITAKLSHVFFCFVILFAVLLFYVTVMHFELPGG